MSALLAEKAGALSRLSATDACGRGAVGDADTMHSQPLFVGVVSDIGAYIAAAIWMAMRITSFTRIPLPPMIWSNVRPRTYSMTMKSTPSSWLMS